MQDTGKQLQVLFACRFPPPYTGENLCSQMTYDLLKNEFQSKIFRLNRNCAVGMAGKFSFSGLFDTFNKLFELRQLVTKNKYDVFYFVPGSSVLGHIRDIFLVRMVRKHVRCIIAHVHSGKFQDVMQERGVNYFSESFVKKIDHFIFLSHY